MSSEDLECLIPWPFVSKPLLAAKAQSKKKKIALIKVLVAKILQTH